MKLKELLKKGNTIITKFSLTGNSEHLERKRFIKHTDTTGIYIDYDLKTMTKGSFLKYPRVRDTEIKQIADNKYRLTIFNDTESELALKLFDYEITINNN